MRINNTCKKYILHFRSNLSYFSFFSSIPSFSNTHLLKLGPRKSQFNSKYESTYIIHRYEKCLKKLKVAFFTKRAIRFSKDSFLEYFFWRLGDLKNESHFLKKAAFSESQKLVALGHFLIYTCLYSIYKIQTS